jgi:hypothetical protein
MNAHADTGYIVDGRNFYVTADGTLRAVDVPVLFDDSHTGTPLAFCGIDGKLFYVYCHEYTEDNKTKYNVDIIRYKNSDNSSDCSSANLLKDTESSSKERSLARYNVWTGGSDIVSGEYKPRLLVYPDKKWLSFNDNKWNATDIMRYVIMKKVTENKSIVQNFYYDKKVTLPEGTEADKDGWWYVDENGKYTVSATPSSSGKSYPSTSTESVYSYCDDGDIENGNVVPDDEERTDGETVSYSVSQAPINDVMVDMLCVETVNTTFKTTYILKSDKSYAIPNADFITPFNNRIFGVDGTKIFASAAGSYVDYDLDTADDFDGNNAWYSATQSGGDFTHICTYGGRPVAFKADMLYELYNDKNPFRIKEISRIGTFNGSSVCEVNSTLFYANKDGIYAYGGSYPRSVSEGFIDKSKLDTGRFTGCAAGSYDGRYFVRVPMNDDTVKSDDIEYEHPILTFDTHTGTWSVLSVFDNDISYFAECDGKFFAVLDNGEIYHMNSGNKAGLHWYFETPVITEGTADRKVLEKVQMLVKFHGSGSVKVSVKYDNGEYDFVGKLENYDSGVHPLYCKVSKSDHAVRYIKFDCVGDVEILTFEQFLSSGGDR